MLIPERMQRLRENPFTAYGIAIAAAAIVKTALENFVPGHCARLGFGQALS